MGSFTILPSLCYVMSVVTYIFHGSSLRFRIPMLFKSLLWSCLPSAVDRNLGPLMPVLLVCAFVSVIVFTYGGVLQQPELVRVDRVLLPHSLGWLDVRSVLDPVSQLPHAAERRLGADYVLLLLVHWAFQSRGFL